MYFIISKKKIFIFGGVAIGLIAVGGILAAVIIIFVLKSNPIGSVVSNGHECSQIGGEILEKGGSAVDAGIATLFCEGVAMPQSCGIGGGFLMTIYDKETGNVHVLNAREVAPSSSTADMYKDYPEKIITGYLAAAVPGELVGYREAYARFGKLPWKEIVQPTIDLCKNGILVTAYLEKTFKTQAALLFKDPILRDIFINKDTNQTYTEGQYIKRPRLAKTLEIIAEEGANALHGGSLMKEFVKDIKNGGGIITEEDMLNYTAVWQEPIKVNLSEDHTLYTVSLPGSGAILAFILNIVKNIFDFSNPDSIENVQRIVESFKFGYGKRTELGDRDTEDMRTLLELLASESHAFDVSQTISLNWTSQNASYYGAKVFNPEDNGTAHISVLAPNGDAVSVTTTINQYFGAAVASPSTGIILNDQMDDFSTANGENGFGVPPSESNFIQPHRRPLSSMCPSIILDKNKDVRLIIGAAGGTKITTSVALTIMKHLWYKLDIQDALDADRFHHQLFPMELDMEENYGSNIQLLKYLEDVGHNYSLQTPNGFAALTSISNTSGLIEASFDKRRKGSLYFVY